MLARPTNYCFGKTNAVQRGSFQRPTSRATLAYGTNSSLIKRTRGVSQIEVGDVGVSIMSFLAPMLLMSVDRISGPSLLALHPAPSSFYYFLLSSISHREGEVTRFPAPEKARLALFSLSVSVSPPSLFPLAASVSVGKTEQRPAREGGRRRFR